LTKTRHLYIIVVNTPIVFATKKSGACMFRDKINHFPPFVKKVFYEHDISTLNLDINKTQTNILMHVSEYGEKSMSEISLMTGLEKSSFTRSADYLEKNGFITRNTSENDRRIITLSLTNKGIKAAKIIKDDYNLYLESLISDFSEKEKKDFFKSLAVVSKYMNKILEGNK
jgi:DNA-binding MarR family transcriptional regulator